MNEQINILYTIEKFTIFYLYLHLFIYLADTVISKQIRNTIGKLFKF